MSTTISPVKAKVIECWGEMGVRWGANRTMAQAHGLFYLSPEALNAEEIAAALGVARSNAGTSLRELEGWGLIRPVHVRGDRRQHFEAVKDVWEIFAIILEERKRRDIDPALAALRQLYEEAQEAGVAEQYTRQRLREALDFFEAMTRLYAELRRLPGGPVGSLIEPTSRGGTPRGDAAEK